MNRQRISHAAVLAFLITVNIVIFSLAHNLSRPAAVAPLPTVAARAQSAAPVSGSIAESVAAAQPNESSIVQIVPGSSTTATTASVPAESQTASASSPQTAPSVAQVNPITNGAQSSVVTTIYGQPNQASAAPDVQTEAREDANAAAAAAAPSDQLGGASLMGASRLVTFGSLSVDFAFANVPLEFHIPVQNTLLQNRLLLPNYENFTVTGFRQSQSWAELILVPSYVVSAGWDESLNLGELVRIIAYASEEHISVYIEGSAEFQQIAPIIPTDFLDLKPVAQVLATSHLFPWTAGQSWYVTQTWHLGRGVDFQPVNHWMFDQGAISDPSIDFAVLASDGGRVRQICSPDPYQTMLIIDHPDGTTSGYLHLDKGSVPQSILGQQVSRGQYLGYLYTGRVIENGGCPYDPSYRYNTICGCGYGIHLHYEFPTFNTLVEGLNPNSFIPNLSYISTNIRLDSESNPGVPTVLEPADGATVENSFNLVLEPGELNQTQAFDFRVEVTTPDDTEFANPIFELGSITDTTIPLNLPNGTWKLRVQQGDTVDRSSEWVTLTLTVADPVLICPGGVPQIDLAIHDALLTRQYNRSYSEQFWVESNASGGVLLVQSKVGHPDAGCPAIAGPLCGPDQPGESFHVALDGRRAATIPDHGHDRWEAFSFMLPLNRGMHMLRADHANLPSSPDRWDSVSFNAAYCINSAPSAVNDSGVTPFGEPITVDVLANDSEPENHTLTILSVSDPAHGTAAVVDGKVVYTPDPGFSGTEVFSYTLQDIVGATASATVTITVEPYEEPPLVCEPNFTQVDIATTAFVLTGQSGMNTRSFTFTLPTDSRSGVLLVAATVGHPEAGCPGATNSPLCIPQDNESATLTIDDIAIGVVPDFGDHGEQQFSFAQGLPAGEHVFTATHVLPAGDEAYNSISLRAIYCVEQEIVVEDPVEMTQEAVSIESDLLATPEATPEPQPAVEQPPVELTVEAAPVESVPVEVPTQEALPPAPPAPEAPAAPQDAPSAEATTEVGG